MKVKILVTIVGRVGDKSKLLPAGNEFDLPDDDAMDFVRAGYAELIEAKPAVKVVHKGSTGKKAVK